MLNKKTRIANLIIIIIFTFCSCNYADIAEDVKEISEINDDNVVKITVLGKKTISVKKDRIYDDIYGDFLDNRWNLSEVDNILFSLKGVWKVDKYVGFVDSSIYFPDLFDLNDNLEESIKDELHNDYRKKVENAKNNIPEIYFSIKEYGGKDTDSNYIYVNGIYDSPISIILSLNQWNDNYPAFVERTTISPDFVVDYPTLYIKFYIQCSEDNQIMKHETATLVITADNRFYFLIDGAFYSLKNLN